MYILICIFMFTSLSFATSCLMPSCYFYFTFSCTPLCHPCLVSHPLCLSSPLTLYFPNPSVPLISSVSESQLPTLNQQAAEDCGNPWNRRDQGCRQGATATLECGASEEIRAVSPARERGGMLRERSEGGGGQGRVRRVRRKQGEQQVCEWRDRNTTP